jgi:DNA invertase Pin-like site-specific DNA recombinase
MEKVVIYARVSTNDQTTENQILKLRTIVEKNE